MLTIKSVNSKFVMRLGRMLCVGTIVATDSIVTMASTRTKLEQCKEKNKKRTTNSNNCTSIDTTRYDHYEWIPHRVMGEDKFDILKGYACLILNREIRIPHNVVINLWQCATIRCTVDGGTNRWYQFLKDLKIQKNVLKPPDLITGDFDSIEEETKAYFMNGISKFIHTPDQSATDFTKAVDIVRPLILEKQFHNIIVFHDSSGRFDQIMGNVNTLFKAQNNSLNIYMLSSSSLTWLLRPGTHSIVIPQNLVENKRWCSLIPIGEKVSNVTTSGLKWDIDNDSLCFGGLVSTSNTYDSSIVTIQTNGNLVWSMGIYSFVDD